MARLTWAVTDLTRDAFLGGRLHLWQPKRGFRAGVDAVLLAAAVPAQTGDRVLELGCGVGTASLCLAARVPSVDICGVELQPEYANLARRNAAENGLTCQIVTADLRALPDHVRNTQYHHVLMNPPYFARHTGTPSRNPGRETALGGTTPLADWVDIAIKRLAPKGHLTLIMRTERLPDVLNHIGDRLGGMVLRPIMARQDRGPELFLLRGILSGRTPFRIAPPLHMHTGPNHAADGDSYTPLVTAVLRNAEKLDIER